MIKFTILLRRKPSMTHEEFVAYHRERHAPCEFVRSAESVLIA